MESAHFLQIWIQPNEKGVAPSHAQRDFGEARKGVLKLVASEDGRGGSLSMYPDSDLYASELERGKTVEHLSRNGYGWLQVVRGTLELEAAEGALTASARDGVAFRGTERVRLLASEEAEFLLFDLDRSTNERNKP